MDEQSPLLEEQKSWHGTLNAYVIGFVLSILFTLSAYFIVAKRWLVGIDLFYAIGSLALLQTIAQLLFFLHIGKESKPRWNILIFTFALLTVGILVAGSIWIMHSLHTRVMMPEHKLFY